MLFPYHKKLTKHPIPMNRILSERQSIPTANTGEVCEGGRKRGRPLWHHMKYLSTHCWRKINKDLRICGSSLSWGKTLGFSRGAVWVIGKLDHWNTETMSLSPITTILRGKLRLFKESNLLKNIYLNVSACT